MKERKTHQKVVTECYLAIKKADEENDTDKLLRVMSRYGKKTRDEALARLKNEFKAKYGENTLTN